MKCQMLGMRIHVSKTCVEVRENWPAKKRSRRLEKKLTKRLGPRVEHVPAAYVFKGVLVVHPEIYQQMKDRMS